jgi:hypothetical protein
MQNVIEIADLALVTVVSFSFALSLQWVAPEGFFRFLLAQSPVQGHAANPHSGLSPKRGIVRHIAGKPRSVP